MEPRRYEEVFQQKRSPKNPPPSPVLVKSHVVEMPRVEVDMVTRSLRYCSNCDPKERKEILQRYFITRLQNEFKIRVETSAQILRLCLSIHVDLQIEIRGIAWYCIVLHSIAWYCMVLHYIALYCMVLHGIA